MVDLCLLDILVASKLWGRNRHGGRADAIEKPGWAVSLAETYMYVVHRVQITRIVQICRGDDVTQRWEDAMCSCDGEARLKSRVLSPLKQVDCAIQAGDVANAHLFSRLAAPAMVLGTSPSNTLARTCTKTMHLWRIFAPHLLSLRPRRRPVTVPSWPAQGQSG